MNSKKIIEIIENVLEDNISIQSAIIELEQMKQDEGNKISCAIRLLKAYENQSYYDFCGHLRQVILNYGYPIRVGNRNFYKFIINNMNEFGITTVGDKADIKFSANPTILPNEQYFTHIYKYENKSIEKNAIGDGRLFNYTKYKTYRSFSQKMLLNRISKMSYGDTLLACLPTGAGKSLSWQLPGISNEYNGLIIVIVPTVALAINHEKSSKIMFDNNGSNLVYPKAYYADCGSKKKAEIKSEILAGVLPILYISPEALMQEEFKNMIIEAANLGRISMLVVDETHLIVDWGSKFRPEFQLIPAFRNSINQTGNKIKTILLSATITENDTSILENIFDDDNNFIQYRADALRPEIYYKVGYCENATHRVQILKQLIKQVPRPIIVYSSFVEYAENFYNSIKECGFKNVRLFTGKTSTRERQIIMDEWDRDNVDIIVATSAFGMGVDKNDIRTIIHTFIPENVSRFYQESGRAGRDGYSAIDYCLIVNSEDRENARKLVKSKLATTETIVDRWFAMKSKAQIEDGDYLWLDTHTTPTHLLKGITGEQNADWNKGVITFLYRNHFIDIVDMSLKNGKDYFVKVKLLNRKVLERQVLMLQEIEPYREIERSYIDLELEKSFELFKSNYCFASMFKEQYRYTQEICSGCPYCEKHNRKPYYNKGDIQIISKNKIKNEECDDISNYIKYNKEILVLCEKYDNLKLDDIIAHFIQEGIHNFIIPRLKQEALSKIFAKLKYFTNIKDFVLLDKYEFENYDIDKLISGPIAIMLDDDKNYNLLLYKFANRYEKEKNNSVLFISKEDEIDVRTGKLITEGQNLLLGKIDNVVGGK